MFVLTLPQEKVLKYQTTAVTALTWNLSLGVLSVLTVYCCTYILMNAGHMMDYSAKWWLQDKK